MHLGNVFRWNQCFDFSFATKRKKSSYLKAHSHNLHLQQTVAFLHSIFLFSIPLLSVTDAWVKCD